MLLLLGKSKKGEIVIGKFFSILKLENFDTKKRFHAEQIFWDMFLNVCLFIVACQNALLCYLRKTPGMKISAIDWNTYVNLKVYPVFAPKLLDHSQWYKKYGLFLLVPFCTLRSEWKIKIFHYNIANVGVNQK